MAKIFHIQASPMGDLSFSKKAAEIYLETYLAANSNDTVDVVDLWKTVPPEFDFMAASGKYKILRGLDHSEAEARSWTSVVETVEQFKSADKVVVSTGMWNFSIPYRLKQYIDVIVQPNHTFSYDPDTGYTGLVTGKPLQLILASGGEYPQGSAIAELDFQKPYLETVFGFMGFSDIRTLRVEGTLSPEAQSNLDRLMPDLKAAARSF